MASKYKLSTNGVIRFDGACIPDAAGNRDWQEYQEWLSAGNEADPMDPVPQPTYKELRADNYPPPTDYLDGFAKSYSPDPVIKAAGVKQMNDYAAACLAVKAEYPKQ